MEKFLTDCLILGEKMKHKKKLVVSKKKDNLEISKEIFLSKGDNIEKNIINLLKNKDNSRK